MHQEVSKGSVGADGVSEILMSSPNCSSLLKYKGKMEGKEESGKPKKNEKSEENPREQKGNSLQTHGVLQEAALRGRQVDFILAVLQTLFSCSK